MQKVFQTIKGKTATLDIPTPWEKQSIFIVAGHKTGSTLLTNIIADISRIIEVPSIPVELGVWRQGFSIEDWPDELYEFLENDGYVFYSFRALQKLPQLESFEKATMLFLVRDPRDIAVSYYFSMAKSHSLPKKGKSREALLKRREQAEKLTIDEFIQSGKANQILDNIQRFGDYLNDETSIFYKYEDVIFEKRKWVAHIAKDLGVELPSLTDEKIADKHDIFPTEENPNAHIRQVIPGGYREKLSEETIDFIYQNFPVFFEKFGYT